MDFLFILMWFFFSTAEVGLVEKMLSASATTDMQQSNLITTALHGELRSHTFCTAYFFQMFLTYNKLQ